MRAALVLLVILALPLAAAETGHSGWYYAGDTFEADGTVYSVEGTGHNRVLLGIGGTLQFISLDECIEDGLSTYCYDDTAYPDDTDHIKYEAGKIFYGYHLSFTTREPEIAVTRTISDDSPLLGEKIEVTVTIENTGEYYLRDLKYEESFPSGLRVSGGTTSSRVIRERSAFPQGAIERFTYALTPERYGTFKFKPAVTYRYDSWNLNESVNDLTVSVDSPISIKTYITPQIELDQDGRYQINITNDHGSRLEIHAVIALHEALEIVDVQGLSLDGANYTLSATLDEDEKISAVILFRARGVDTYPVDATVRTVIGGEESVRSVTEKVKSKGAGLDAEVTLSSGRAAYFPGTRLTVRGILENRNDATTFNRIAGAMVSPLFSKSSFSHARFSPGKEIVETEVEFITPEVNATTVFPIEFSGTYETPGGNVLTFSKEESVTVEPLIEKVRVVRILDPKEPVPGENVTVTIRLKNTWDKYLTADLHEKIPEGFEKLSGLSFASVSLDRGEEKQAYIYQLAIPDSAEGNFSLTTSVLVKDDPLSKDHVDEIVVRAPENEIQEDVPDVPVPSVEPEDAQKEEGFFSRVWDSVTETFGSMWGYAKGLFI